MLHLASILGLFILVVVAAILVARLLFPLPDISGRSSSSAEPASGKTWLGRLMLEAAAAHPGKSGVLPLASGRDALSSRLKLIDAAEQSIDAQYYIWHDDTSGILVLAALYRAARRGVRIRLLLDDNGVPGLDPFMAALHSEDGFQIRLFNPSTLRRFKLLGYAFDFMRMNRRMHNKSLIVDGAAVIVGGRNIGDEYYQLGDEPFFFDMDVLATGAIVAETAAMFDQYWNCSSVFGVEQIVDGPGNIEGFRARVAQVEGSAEAADVIAEAEADIAHFLPGLDQLQWTDVALVADDPVKGLGTARRDQLMITRLGEILGGVSRRLDLVSAYFIPGARGTQFLTELERSGVEVRILTNAISTTDVLLVHAGYSRYRRKILQAGIDLYELKLRDGQDSGAEEKVLPFGLSGSSMHAKTFAVDDARIYIGSFNFDPRSAMLNCEMGFLIDSPSLARRLRESFDDQVEKVSYRPALTPEGKMVWHETAANGEIITYQEEPDASLPQQVFLAVVGLLPIEWML